MSDVDYSKIFKSSNHDTRRSILVMLFKQDRSFTELYEALEITSSHLDYPLQVLGSLVVKRGQRYALSPSGKATINWINNIGSPPQKPKTSFFYKNLSVILLVLLPSLICNYGETFHINFNNMMSGLAVTSIIILILMYPIVLVTFTNEYLMAPALHTGFNHLFPSTTTNTG